MRFSDASSLREGVYPDGVTITGDFPGFFCVVFKCDLEVSSNFMCTKGRAQQACKSQAVLHD